MRFLAAIFFAVLIAAKPGPASAFPDGPVRLLVGWPAGGPVDVVARLLSVDLGKRLGVPVVIENRPGTSGMLATDFLLSQRSDGQTLLLCTHYETMNPVMYRSAKYKVDDLAGVSLLARYYLVMATSAKSELRSVQDVIKQARSNPGNLTYGTSGPGSTQDLLMRQLGELTDIRMQSVPFRGAPPALLELMAGRIDIFLSPSGSVIPMAASGQVRLLAATSAERLRVAPDVPTFLELGYPLKLYGWIGLCAKAGTPPQILQRINREVSEITKESEYRSKIEATGQIAEGSSPEDLQKIMNSMTDEISGLVNKYGIRVE